MDAIFKQDYPISKAFFYAEALAGIRQDEFYTIENYLAKIEYLLVRLNASKICLNHNLRIRKRKPFTRVYLT